MTEEDYHQLVLLGMGKLGMLLEREKKINESNTERVTGSENNKMILKKEKKKKTLQGSGNTSNSLVD